MPSARSRSRAVSRTAGKRRRSSSSAASSSPSWSRSASAAATCSGATPSARSRPPIRSTPQASRRRRSSAKRRANAASSTKPPPSSSPTTTSASSGATRFSARMPRSSSSVRSRRLSARHARARARSSRCAGSASRSPAGSRASTPATGPTSGGRTRRARGPGTRPWRSGRTSRGRRRGFGGLQRVDRLVTLDRGDQVLADPERGVDLGLDLLRDLDVLVQVRLGVVAALAEPLVAVGEERARLGDHVVLDREVEDAARAGYALTELDVEFGLAERRRDLVLDHLHTHAVADRLGAVLERLDPADVEPLRRVELQRPPARLGLRRSEHHPDLLADLVDEQAEGLRAVQVAGELAHRLAHHPRLHADRLVAHLAL